MIKNIQVTELSEHIENGTLFLDVREDDETPKFKFPNHLHIPMSEMEDRHAEIPKDEDVLVYCHSGGRSADVVATLNIHYGYENLYNVVGGSISLAKEFPELIK